MRGPQLYRALALALGFLLAGLVTGRLELVVLAAPFAGVVVLRAGARPAPAELSLALSTWRCVQGEAVTVTATVTAPRRRADVALLVDLDPRLEVRDGANAALVTAAPGAPATVTFTLVPDRWGIYAVGPVRARSHAGGHVAVARLPEAPAQLLRVLPTDEAFSSRASLPLPRALVGAHVARRAGEGIEFAETRPYVAGDPLKHVHWRATARRGELFVADRNPERNSEIVVFLDTFVDVGPKDATTLDIGVRAAIAIARHYLALMDRVAVVGFGGVLRWLPGGSGRRHLHTLVEHVIGSETVRTTAWREVEMLPPAVVPPSSLVIACSPLLDRRAIAALGRLARTGHGVVVVDTSPEGYAPATDAVLGDVATLLWRMERDADVRALVAAGVPVVPWAQGGGLDAVLGAVQQRIVRAPRVRR